MNNHVLRLPSAGPGIHRTQAVCGWIWPAHGAHGVREVPGMKLKTLRNNMTFRQVNILIFIVILLIAVGFTDFILFSNWRSSAEKNATNMATNTNTEIFGKVDAFIDIPRQINDMNRRVLENGIVDLGNEAERERFFVGILSSLNQDIYSFSFGAESGAYYGARRDLAGTIQIMRNNFDTGGNSWYYSVKPDQTAGDLAVQAGKFDPRTRDWYKVAAQSGKPMFSPIYKHFIMDDMTVSAATPIFSRNGRMEGVLGTHVILSSINRYLESIIKDREGFAAIVERETGALVANSFGARNFETAEGSQIRRLTLAESGKHAMSSAYQRYQKQKTGSLRVVDGSEAYYVRLTEYQKEGLDWIVLSAIPERHFMGSIESSILLALLLTLLAIVIAAVVYTMATDRFLKPVGNLIDATEKLTRGDLSQRVAVVRNDEIGRISRSFNNMADTLNILVDNLEDTVHERTHELEASNESLRQADRNKNEFINALSHELRNPLAAIVAGLSVLDMAQEPAKKERAREIIHRQTAQLSNLVDDLLDITRITRNKIMLKKERIDVSEVAARAADGQRPLYEAKGIHLVTDIVDHGLYIQGDPVRLTQIIGNLLHNAYKFNEKGGTTWISVYRGEHDEAVISIRDNGIGIKAEFLPSLFEPFTQADMSLDRRHGGLGLGLSIVKGIAELHGGRVHVESAGLGQGAEFIIYLPLEKQSRKSS